VQPVFFASLLALWRTNPSMMPPFICRPYIVMHLLLLGHHAFALIVAMILSQITYRLLLHQNDTSLSSQVRSADKTKPHLRGVLPEFIDDKEQTPTEILSVYREGVLI
jgi:hypothetical protein